MLIIFKIASPFHTIGIFYLILILYRISLNNMSRKFLLIKLLSTILHLQIPFINILSIDANLWIINLMSDRTLFGCLRKCQITIFSSTKVINVFYLKLKMIAELTKHFILLTLVHFGANCLFDSLVAECRLIQFLFYSSILAIWSLQLLKLCLFSLFIYFLNIIIIINFLMILLFKCRHFRGLLI